MKAAPELLSLAGFLCDHMIKMMENKTEELALLAQTPPTLHQWMKKQVQCEGERGRGRERERERERERDVHAISLLKCLYTNL